jgi:hypothetical protein
MSACAPTANSDRNNFFIVIFRMAAHRESRTEKAERLKYGVEQSAAPLRVDQLCTKSKTNYLLQI